MLRFSLQTVLHPVRRGNVEWECENTIRVRRTKTFIVRISSTPHHLPYVTNIFHLSDVALFLHTRKTFTPSIVQGNKWTCDAAKETPIFNNGYRALRSVARFRNSKLFRCTLLRKFVRGSFTLIVIVTFCGCCTSKM